MAPPTGLAPAFSGVTSRRHVSLDLGGHALKRAGAAGDGSASGEWRAAEVVRLAGRFWRPSWSLDRSSLALRSTPKAGEGGW